MKFVFEGTIALGYAYSDPVSSRIGGIWRDLVRASSVFLPRPRSLVQFGLGALRIIWSEVEGAVALD